MWEKRGLRKCCMGPVGKISRTGALCNLSPCWRLDVGAGTCRSLLLIFVAMLYKRPYNVCKAELPWYFQVLFCLIVFFPCNVQLLFLVYARITQTWTIQNFHCELILVARVDRSCTAHCHKDFSLCEDLFWKRVKETRHLLAQYQFDHKHKILKLSREKYPRNHNLTHNKKEKTKQRHHISG